jgi:hypothetical protein
MCGCHSRIHYPEIREATPEEMRGVRSHIVTCFDYPPIPIRSQDWSAIRDGDEPPCNCGRGATEKEAILDLLEQEEDSE